MKINKMIVFGAVFFLMVSTFACAECDNSVYKIRVVHTGSTRATLEACGCRSHPAGGIAVRAQRIDELKKQSEVPLLVLDSGYSTDKGRGDQVDRLRNLEYLDLMVKAGYQAVGLSKTDLQWGLDFFKEAMKKSNIPFVASDLKMTGDETPFWKESLIIDTGCLKVGVIALSGEVKPSDNPDYPFFSEDPVVVLKREMTKLEPITDIQILLNNYAKSYSNEIIANSTGVDLFLYSSSGPQQEWYNMRTTFAAGGSYQGKNLSLIHLDINPETHEAHSKVENFSMDLNGEKSPEITAALSMFYGQIMADPKLQPEFIPFSGFDLEKDPKQLYAGPDSCKDCHKEAYQQWKRTPHEYCYQNMITSNTFIIPECIVCHVTGYGKPSGFSRIDRFSPFQGVSCETCHGPGKLHVDDPEKNKLRTMTIETGRDVCTQCHRGDKWGNGIKGAYENYYQRIKHK